MPMTNYILGVLVFMTLYKVSGPLRGVICLYSVYKFLTLGPFYNGYGVDPFYIWYSYPWYNNYSDSLINYQIYLENMRRGSYVCLL
jgi:hypothetical protein